MNKNGVSLKRLMNFFDAIGVLDRPNTSNSAVIDSQNDLPGHSDSVTCCSRHCQNRLNSKNSANRNSYANNRLNGQKIDCQNCRPNGNLSKTVQTRGRPLSGGRISAAPTTGGRPGTSKNQFYANLNGLASIKLEKLKALILDQAKELKKQNRLISEKDVEIRFLNDENEMLRRIIEQLHRGKSGHQFSLNGVISNRGNHSKISAFSSAFLQRKNKRRKSSSVEENFDESEYVEEIGAQPKIRRSNKPGPSHSQNNENCNEDCQIYEIVTDNVDLRNDEIITPGWRLSNISASVVLEGTENITDESYAKRHQKLEAEEKRIIKRDRMRERQMERLRLRRKQNSVEICEYMNRFKTFRKRNHCDSCSSPVLSPSLSQIEAISIVHSIRKANLSPKNSTKSPTELTSVSPTRRASIKRKAKKPRN